MPPKIISIETTPLTSRNPIKYLNRIRPLNFITHSISPPRYPNHQIRINPLQIYSNPLPPTATLAARLIPTRITAAPTPLACHSY
jgi:hypothetical protein